MALMILGTLVGTFGGLWNESDRIARLWQNQSNHENMDSRFQAAMLGSMKIGAFAILLVCWVVLAYATVWGLGSLVSLVRGLFG